MPFFKTFCMQYDQFSRFGSLFILILLSVFLAYISLGAGSNERMQTPLGAHQRRFRSQ